MIILKEWKGDTYKGTHRNSTIQNLKCIDFVLQKTSVFLLIRKYSFNLAIQGINEILFNDVVTITMHQLKTKCHIPSRWATEKTSRCNEFGRKD